MKRVLLWVAGVTVGALLLLALIGYLAGPQKPATESAQTTTSASKLSQLKSTLESHDLDLCTVYHWVEDMEQRTRQFVEKEQLGAGPAERNNSIEFMRDQEWSGYCIKHKIPDSLRTQINAFGLIECK